jgi:hypothetical protein
MTARPRIPYSQTVTKVSYGDAEVRGKMRLWTTELARRYRIFNHAYRDVGMLPLAEDMVKKTRLGRRRAFNKLAQMLGPGVTLETVRLDGKFPLAVWSILKPRDAVIVNATPESGNAQDCVTVNYVLAGAMPHRPAGDIGEGLWTLEVPDHALGRCIKRCLERGIDPSPTAIIREAHHNLLRLRAAAVMPDNVLGSGHRFLVKAGPGGFVCQLRFAPDVSHGNYDVHVFAGTWLADDMLHEDQVLLVDDGKPGERLIDRWLVPALLRHIVKLERKMVDVILWSPGLPEMMLAKPQGSA